MEQIEKQHCPLCNTKNLIIAETDYDIPSFGKCFLMSMSCSNCMYHQSDIESEEQKDPIKLTFEISGKNDLKIATPQTQAGKDEATLSTETKGPANKIALSSAYILDFLTHTDGDRIQLKVTDSMHPAVFRIIGEESYLHLIMPLRLQEDAK